ncbi:hypothetical protein GOODEAATRI_013370 [Goodea atripinnis]|uniref:Uncharacterized protein n=1 Tax=Goodea atripinnis TaxID=208336 RepID=A0ABV0NU98_9TELE
MHVRVSFFYNVTLIITIQPICKPVSMKRSNAELQKQFEGSPNGNPACVPDIDQLTQRLLFLFDSQLCELGSLDGSPAARNVWCVTQLERPTHTHPLSHIYIHTQTRFRNNILL